ncbi:unnamed protein product [Prunus armeniaca]
MGAYRLQDKDGEIHAAPINDKWLKKFYPTMWDSQAWPWPPCIPTPLGPVLPSALQNQPGWLRKKKPYRAAIPNQGFALFGYGLEDVQQLEVGPALVYNESLVEPTISIEDIDDGVVDMVLMRPRFQRSTMEKPRRARERPT